MENQIEGIKSKLEDKGIKLNQPLPMEKILDFENNYNIKLPSELVNFYTQISNGAILYPNEDICNLEPFENWWFSKKNIHKNFTVNNDISYDDFCELENQGKSCNFIHFGNIALMDLGCGMSYNIIIKGNLYGEIFGSYEMYLELTHKNFFDWFESCLDGKDKNML